MTLFTAEVWSRFGLVRYYVLFFIKLSNRHMHVAGIKRNPNARWINQIARNVTTPDTGFLVNTRYLIMDRDTIFNAEYRESLKREGTEAVPLPPRSPNMTAYTERYVGTIEESCLSRMTSFGDHSLRTAIGEFVQYSHHERIHQGLGNRLIDPAEDVGLHNGPIACRQRLGGILQYHCRQAA
ncbi:MAG: transposase [Phycisphaerales bacterium]|nr:transposase [Phycisphaerales bacterium]MCB9864312.1 transposase [Phycisphaerales bacterium]